MSSIRFKWAFLPIGIKKTVDGYETFSLFVTAMPDKAEAVQVLAVRAKRPPDRAAAPQASPYRHRGRSSPENGGKYAKIPDFFVADTRHNDEKEKTGDCSNDENGTQKTIEKKFAPVIFKLIVLFDNKYMFIV